MRPLSLLMVLLGAGAATATPADAPTAEAQASTEEQTRLDVLANVRGSYFSVVAQQTLLQVARETVENEESHLRQVQAQVEVGTRATSKAQLNQAMGVEGSTDYAVQDVTVDAVEGEDQPTDALVETALERRPDLAASALQLRAQQQLAATSRGTGPALRPPSAARRWTGIPVRPSGASRARSR